VSRVNVEEGREEKECLCIGEFKRACKAGSSEMGERS
jgi:hypothetical protein